jgi:hypothetical protein
MSYNIVLTDGASLVTIADGTVDTTTTSLSLVGRNYAGYGQFLNDNFIRILENASSQNAPTNPLVGQLWWNNVTKKLNIWQGSVWKVVSGSATGSVPPTSPNQGDVWWNTSTGQLYAYNGSQWTVVGPSTASGTALTSVLPYTINDINSIQHTVGNIVVNNKLTAVFSSDSVPFSLVTAMGGLTTIYPGINMVANTAITTSALTANTATLGNVTAGNITITSAVSANSITANVATLTTITSNLVNSANVTSNVGIYTNLTVSSLASIASLNVSGSSSLNSVTAAGTINATTLQQGGNQVLHSANYNTYAPTLTGTGASGNWNINVAGLFSSTTSDYRHAYANSTPYSIAQRDVNGNLVANFFSGTASSAEYADLAERYAADAVYTAGTVMEFGGTAEITQVVEELSENVFGVISTNAAYLMNKSAGADDTHPPIALSGRVPVRVVGIVNKGDRLVSAGNGLARSGTQSEITPFNVIGRAISCSTDSGESIIEAIVRVNV